MYKANTPLHEYMWPNLLEQAITCYITWPHRKSPGGLYKNRFEGLSSWMKCTRLFVFGDPVMQQLAPSPIFTDGIHVYIHESLANDAWKERRDREKSKPEDLMRPIHNAVMRSIEWARTGETDTQEVWKHIELVQFKEWVQKLQGARAVDWLETLGLSMRTGDEEIKNIVLARRDLAKWLSEVEMEKEKEKERLKAAEKLADEDSDEIIDDEPIPALKKPPAKPPIWVGEVDRMIRTRWDSCATAWDEDFPLTMQRWNVRWMLAERMGMLIGQGRNEVLKNGTESGVLREGMNAAISGWMKSLAAMLEVDDWASFGRSALAYLQTCVEYEALTFEEKTESTTTAAAAFEAIPHKMAWIDFMSGSYDHWLLHKFLLHDLERFWNLYQKNECSIESTLACYSMLPEGGVSGGLSFRKEYLRWAFGRLLDNAGEESYKKEEKQSELMRRSFNLLVDMVRGIDGDLAQTLVYQWHTWANEEMPDWFDRGKEEFEKDEFNEYSAEMEDMYDELMTVKRWTAQQKRHVETYFT
jgi:hypothetical protein